VFAEFHYYRRCIYIDGRAIKPDYEAPGPWIMRRMSSNCNEAVDLEWGGNALDDESHRGAGRRDPLPYSVQNKTVTAENEEALIEWLIITRVWMDGLIQPRCD
jgi:hypothetical protein